MSHLISLEDIHKQFDDNKVIKGLDCTIKKNEVFGIIGRSGGGKSTFLKILIGVYPIDSGKISYDGNDITGKTDVMRKHVGVTTQENAFYEKLTILENMHYYANLYNRGKENISSILRSVELFDKKHLISEDISGGMKRRLDFAISLIHDPELLILDEPTTGLDPILVDQFWEVVLSHKRRNKTIIVISHIFDELQAHCDRIGILHEGTMKTHTISKKTNLSKLFKKETE